MDKLVIFGDANLLSTKILMQEMFDIIGRRKDIALAGVIDTARYDPRIRIKRIIEFLVVATARKIFNPYDKFPTSMSTVNLYDICRKADVRVLIPGNRDVNNRDFVNFMKDTIRPTLGLSIGCCQIFKRPLIDAFEVFANYHNGLLPKYRGLSSTSLSLYFDEECTGFTFHLVNEAIDEGNVLIQDAIRIPESVSRPELEYRKATQARKYLEAVLEMMIKRSGWIVQKGASIYFGEKDLKALTTIDCPSEVSFEEIERRLRSFGALRFRINDEFCSVTKIKKLAGIEQACPKVSFITRDHVVFAPTRVSYLPIPIYKLYRSIQKLC